MEQDQSKSDEQAKSMAAAANKKRKYDENGSGETGQGGGASEYSGAEENGNGCGGADHHGNGNGNGNGDVISVDGANGLDNDDNNHHHQHQYGNGSEKNGNESVGNGGVASGAVGGGDHSSSSSQHDAYKSSNTNNGNSNGGNKRTQRVITGDNEVFLKLLIPSTVAGGVIGRGGERIAQIQKDTNVKMKMSKALDHYPNTNERVCLIIGSIKSVLKAHEMIVERIQEKTNGGAGAETGDMMMMMKQSLGGHNRGGGDDEHDRSNQIKLLIPNNTAGLLIGKGGAYIKQIKDESGSFVQISSKQTDLPERIVTIEGDMERRNRALQMVIKKIAEDPSHNSVTNLTYTNSSSSSNNNNMHGGGGHSNMANNNHNGSNNNVNSIDHHHQSSQLGAGNCNGNMMSNQAPNNKYDFNSAATYLAGLSNLALLIINCGGSFQMTSESLKIALRNAGYSSSASSEIIDAITLLMGYGLITKMPPSANGNANGPNQNHNFACNPQGLMGGGSNMGNNAAPGAGFNFMPPNVGVGGGGNMNNSGLIGGNSNGVGGRDHHTNPSLINGNSNGGGFGGSTTSLNGVGGGGGGANGSNLLPMFANGGGGGGGGYGNGNGVVNNGGKLKSFF